MAALNFNALFFNHEISFCKVYNVESKDKLEKLFVSNRISFFVEWQEKGLWERFFNSIGGNDKNVFTIHINEADTMLARDLVEGLTAYRSPRRKFYSASVLCRRLHICLIWLVYGTMAADSAVCDQ